MRPDEPAEGLFVQDADAVRHVLGRDVECHLRQEQVGPDARRGADARAGAHGVHQPSREAARREAVEGEIRRRVDETLVDRVDVHVLGADEFEVDAVDLGGYLHVVTHARLCHDVVDTGRYLEDAAPVAYAELLHGGRDGQADGRGPAVRIGYHEVRREGVAAAVGAFHARVERLQVDADVGALRTSHGPSVRTYVSRTSVR